MKSLINVVNEAVNTNTLTVTDIKKLTQKHDYPFKTIICLSRGTNKNDTEKIDIYIETVCKVNNMKYIRFDCETIKYDFSKNSYKIYDGKTSITLTNEDKKTTVIFKRKIYNDNEDSISISDDLDKHGFIVINKRSNTEVFNDKFKTYNFLNKHDIPQSRTKLIEYKDISKENFDINKFLEDIYPEIKTSSKDKIDKLKYVIKIPNGACGKGVFTTTGENILGLVQAIFEIQPKQQLIIQRFEDSIGGDIRINVITYNNQQEIICAIKRVKPKTDFRSNISLGAKAEIAELTDKQKELALKTAKSSGLIWCAVDLMPIEKNIDGYDNIIVECNPTSENGKGIDDIIGTNLVNLILNALETKI